MATPHTLTLPLFTTTGVQQTTSSGAKFSIGSLGILSFHHLIILSFFVTVKRVPDHYANFSAVETALTIMLCVFEVIFGLTFINSMPATHSKTAVEYFCLVLANAFQANVMIYMLEEDYLLLGTSVWWVLCLIISMGGVGVDFGKQIGEKFSSTPALCQLCFSGTQANNQGTPPPPPSNNQGTPTPTPTIPTTTPTPTPTTTLTPPPPPSNNQGTSTSGQ
ncbi:hypothetical protein TSUD_298240 [Trifolium subterraneum]|nr:hypothetical protein TSUD_298240 [Trifolium subterraneum]